MIISSLNIEYSSDFPFVCTNAMLLSMRNNAIAYVNRALVDESNRSLLKLFNINFKANAEDRFFRNFSVKSKK